MIWILAIVFAAGTAMGGWGVNYYNDAEQARKDKAIAVAEAKIAAADEKAKTEAANKIIDMQASFDAGETNAKTVTKTVYVKGQAYVANTPVFNLAQCVVPADGMFIANSARANLRVTSFAGSSDAAVPVTGADPGRPAINPLLANPAGYGAVGGVHPAPRPVDSSGQVPTGSQGRARPKPVPIK